MCTYIYKHSLLLLKEFTDCRIYCILGNGEVIKYHIFIFAEVIELSDEIEGLRTG